jgi:hypothetical protein
VRGNSAGNRASRHYLPKARRAPNGTVAKLRTAPHARGDAARQLPRLTMHSEEANCN